MARPQSHKIHCSLLRPCSEGLVRADVSELDLLVETSTAAGPFTSVHGRSASGLGSR